NYLHATFGCITRQIGTMAITTRTPHFWEIAAATSKPQENILLLKNKYKFNIFKTTYQASNDRNAQHFSSSIAHVWQITWKTTGNHTDRNCVL
ncbi:hypothetical protein ACJX0J_031551, partial [Zea mays]